MEYADFDISQVNFTDARDIEGSASLIFTVAGSLQLFIPSATRDHERSQLRRQAKIWVSEVDRHIDSLTPGDSLTAINPYDLIHRIAYGCPADSVALDRRKLYAFDSYMRGDTSVDAYTLQYTVAQEIRRRNRAFLGGPLQWESTCLDRWHKQFITGVSSMPIGDYDTLRRVSLLLSSDLWAFETRNEDVYKRTLFERHSHYLNLTQQMDTATLSALHSFLSSAAAYIAPSSYLSHEAAINAALLARPDLNPYTRAALTLTNYK